jgi:hypothetical protein
VYEAFLQTTTFVADDFSRDNNYAADSNLQPGDIVLIYHDNTKQYAQYQVWLDHVAMYVDQGLLLEKSGSGAETLFRFVDYDTFDKSWGIGVLQFQVRRPRRVVDVVQDLSLNGRYSLPIVKALLRQGVLDESLPQNPEMRGWLCGAYDEDTKQVRYTQVISTTGDPFLWDEETHRATLPPYYFQPFLDSATPKENGVGVTSTKRSTKEADLGRHDNL